MSSFQKPIKPGWENHAADHDPNFAVLALPTEIYADTYAGIAALRHVEGRCLAHLRGGSDGKRHGLLAIHTEADLLHRLWLPKAGLLVLNDRLKLEIAGLLLYFAGLYPGIPSEVAAAIRAHAASEGRDEAQVGYAEVCCIQRGPWGVAYPDMHARMILDLRKRGIHAMYGIVHVENASLLRHVSLGYEIVNAGNPIPLPRPEQSREQSARYHLARVEVNSPRQDELLQQMRERNVAFMDLDL